MTTQLSDIEKLIGVEFPVLDQGSVALVDIMPHPSTGSTPDMAVVTAARTSFLGETKGEESDKKLLRYLYRNQHSTPFEMIEFKFKIHAPVLFWWQAVRHRTASLSLQSGRYVPFDEDQCYIPTEWRLQSASNKQGSDGVAERDVEDTIITALNHKHGDMYPFDYAADELWGLSDLLKWYMDTGYSIYSAALKGGIAKEQARLFLPAFGLYYTGIIKFDARNLLNFFQLRLDNHAQEEIRLYAETMYAQIFKPCMAWTAEVFEELTLKKE